MPFRQLIVKFVTERQDEKASNAEINRELAAIKRAFSLAVTSGKVLSRPHIPMLKETTSGRASSSEPSSNCSGACSRRHCNL
jgi:hypothetical protein